MISKIPEKCQARGIRMSNNVVIHYRIFVDAKVEVLIRRFTTYFVLNGEIILPIFNGNCRKKSA